MATLHQDLDKLSADVKAEIARVAGQFRAATDEAEKQRLEAALDELESQESDILDLRLRFTQEQLRSAADAIAIADLRLKREALSNVLSSLAPAPSPTPTPAPTPTPTPTPTPAPTPTPTPTPTPAPTPTPTPTPTPAPTPTPTPTPTPAPTPTPTPTPTPAPGPTPTPAPDTPAEPPAQPPGPSTIFSGPKINISERELDLLARVARSEVGHFGKYGAEQLEGGLHAVVDTIINRVAHPRYPTTLEGVVDQPAQFSAINAAGTWTSLPQASTKIFGIVKRHVIARCGGKASEIKGATHFLNPYLSSRSALRSWGQHVVDNAVAVYGNDDRRDVHYHGFAPGAHPPPSYTLSHKGDVQHFNGDGTPHGTDGEEGVTVTDIVGSARREWDLWGRSTWNLVTRTRRIGHRDDEPEFSRYVLDNYCAFLNARTTQAEIEHDEYAWSAVAISFMLKQAGVTREQFKFSQSHSVYIVDSIARKKTSDASALYWGYRIDDPLATPEPGDLIGCPRGRGMTRNKALAFYDRTGRYNSHTDLVVAKRAGELDVIGGNVSDSVTMKTLPLDANGRIVDDKHFWFVVMKKN